MDEGNAVADDIAPKLLEAFQNLQLMKNKKTQLQIAIETEKILQSQDESQDLDEIKNRIERIREQILEEAAVKNSIELSVQRIQMSDVIYRLLIDDEVLTNGDEALLGNHKKFVEERLKKQTELSAEIIQKTEEMKVKQHQVTKLRKESLILAAKRKKLLSKVQEAKEQKPESPCNSEMQCVAEKVRDTEMTLMLIMPILQCLIVGSGVNWAQDTYLKELMLSLGRPLDELLQDKS